MFTNLETNDFRSAMGAHGDGRWNSMTIEALRHNDRNIAIGAIAKAIQWFAMRQPIPEDLLAASLYTLAVQRVDFYFLALELVQAAESSDRTLVKELAAEEPAEQMAEEAFAA